MLAFASDKHRFESIVKAIGMRQHMSDRNATILYIGAPVRTRTRTNGSEDRCAIHYTTRA